MVSISQAAWDGLVSENVTLKTRLAEAEREQDDMHRVRLLLYDERDALKAQLAEVEAELAFARSSGDESAIEYRALRERLAEAEAWIRQHPPQYGGDHACALCYPHSDVLVAGFVCAYHRASNSAASQPPVRGFRDEPNIEERVFHASLMDGATPQPPVPRDSELRQQIGEDMAKFYEASQPNVEPLLNALADAALECDEELDAAIQEDMEQMRRVADQPSAAPDDGFPRFYQCRTGCIDDKPHQWDGPEWVSEDGCGVSATCSRCGMTAMHHSLMTSE